MTTQTTEPQSPSSPLPLRDSHCFILTLELPGRASFTTYGTYTPTPGMTRLDAFQVIRNAAVDGKPSMTTANTIFFSLEPNAL